jgi:ethanolamine ammonia-lyase small subunit
MFLDDLRINGAVGVAGHFDLDRPDLGEHRLGPSAVTRIAAATAHWVVLVIAQVLGHLSIQRGLQHVLRQLVEQPVGPDQFNSLFLRLR